MRIHLVCEVLLAFTYTHNCVAGKKAAVKAALERFQEDRKSDKNARQQETAEASTGEGGGVSSCVRVA